MQDNNHTWPMRKALAEIDKCDTGEFIKLNNILVKRIRLKVFFSESTSRMFV